MTAYADTQYGSKVIASDRSNYWRYYGLHRDPFMPIVEDSNFFLPARWEQYFDLLQYLCESTNVLLNVVGVKGSGKTTFMRQFIAQASDNSQICRLVGSTVLTAVQLSKTLIKDFNLNKLTGETTEEQWEVLCLNLQAGTQPYLLVIDDAHRLPQETLKVILNLIKQQSEHQMRLHILLIGEVQLTNMLNSLKEGETDRELVHTINLEALNLQDTEAYLKHRLLAAGLPGGMPLRPIDVARIYKLSEGVPGRINAVARQVLIDVMQQRQLYGFAHFIRTRRTQFLGGAVILIVLVVLALVLTRGTQDPVWKFYKLLVSEKTNSASVVTNNTAATAAPTTVTPDKTMVIPTAIINKAETQAMAPATNNTIKSTPQPATTKTTVNTSKMAANEILPASVAIDTGNKSTTGNEQWYQSGMVEFQSPASKHGAKNSAKPQATTATVASQPIQTTKLNNSVATPATIAPNLATKPATNTATTHTVAPKTPALIKTEQPPQIVVATTPATSPSDKLLAADSPLLSNTKNYTLQLIGVSSKTAVNEFITKNQLDDQAYYYHTNFHGKDWYVVVYGNYSTRQAAEAAIDDLPATIHSLHPWPRTMANVQASIRRGEESASQITTQPATAVAQPTTAIKPVAKKTIARKTEGTTTTKDNQDDGIDVPLIE